MEVMVREGGPPTTSLFEFFKGQLVHQMSVQSAPGRTKLIAIATTALVWVTHSCVAVACIPVRAKPERVQFSRVVANVQEISLVQVVDVQPLPGKQTDSLLEDTHKFTLRTLERLKGVGPFEFTLTGRIDQNPTKTRSAEKADHEGVGTFWTAFPPVCDFGVPNILSRNEKLLVMRTPQGELPQHRLNLAPITDESDPLISEIRTLIQNPALEKGRTAPFEHFLLESPSIQIMETTDCRRWRILNTLWGKQMTMDQLLEDHELERQQSECAVGDRRLIVVVPSGWPGDYALLQLKITRGADIVDFTGLQQGTDQGLVRFNLKDGKPDPFAPSNLWYSQIDFKGKLVWNISGLEDFLRSASARQPVQVH